MQCDEAKPTCNQCTKSRRQCPGYKDDFDLIFRNETKATERRAQRKTSGRPAAHRVILCQRPGLLHSSRQQSLPAVAREAERGQVILPALSTPPEGVASCHFLANFVLVPRENTGRGWMDYTLALLKGESASASFTHAFNACAFAALGNRVTSNSVNLADCALSEYTKALAATHVALKDPQLSKADGTLAAVLLLGFFEVRCVQCRGNAVSRTSS